MLRRVGCYLLLLLLDLDGVHVQALLNSIIAVIAKHQAGKTKLAGMGLLQNYCHKGGNTR
ncbi:hypothetical protein EYF80_006592 [Liparis tanakae]|uniref:Uncharacterized protein n=1 Tax=Liparis tanakae TaxID=230148 RepID=A0A4Z2IYC9_9TELE|nr:hypothetical protein EYF80_006592 [Liparis tanakae]